MWHATPLLYMLSEAKQLTFGRFTLIYSDKFWWNLETWALVPGNTLSYFPYHSFGRDQAHNESSRDVYQVWSGLQVCNTESSDYPKKDLVGLVWREIHLTKRDKWDTNIEDLQIYLMI